MILLLLLILYFRLLLPLFIAQDERKVSTDSIPRNLVAHVTNCRFREFLSEEDTLDSVEQSDYHFMPIFTQKKLINLSLSGKRGFDQTIPSKMPSRIPSSAGAPSFKKGHSRQGSNV